MILLTTAIATATIVGILLFNPSGSKKKQVPVINSSTSKNTSPKVSRPKQNELIKIIGRWLRPDGGYTIEITNIGQDGSLDAAYFNPRPINVSQAEIAMENGSIKIFIELRDVGYPGARYSLVYLPQEDTLKGLYYQPSVGQSFEVIFVRIPS
jgi:hypothetical protein